MSKHVAVPMDSYRLAEYAVQLPCYVCGEDNNWYADLCRYCFAPMALAQQAHSQRIQPQMIATIGSSGAGKTVYLGMLTDMLSRPNSDLQILARGAFSISLQQNTTGALRQCYFPDKTPNEPDRWNWLHCQVQKQNRRRPVEMIMPDMAGEAILEEIDHPGTYPVVKAFLSKCTGVMVLIDAAELQGDQQQDFFAMKIVSYLCELNPDRKKGWPNRPVAMVFTKADECESCFADPDAYAKKHASGLKQRCSQLRRHQFFASGVAGACAARYEIDGRRQMPLRIEPRGIVEPFQWIIDQLTK